MEEPCSTSLKSSLTLDLRKRELLIVHPRGGRWGSKWIRHKAGSAQPTSAGSTAPGPVVPAHFRVTAGPLTEANSGSWPVVPPGR